MKSSSLVVPNLAASILIWVLTLVVWVPIGMAPMNAFAQQQQQYQQENGSSGGDAKSITHDNTDSMDVSVKYSGGQSPPVQVKRTKYEVIHLRGQNQDPDYFEREVVKSLERDQRRRGTTRVVDNNSSFIASKVSRRSGVPTPSRAVSASRKLSPKIDKVDRAPAGVAASPSAAEGPRKEKEAMKSQEVPANKGKRRLANPQ